MASPVEEYRQWRRRDPAIGCRFARVIAIDPLRYSQIFEIVDQGATVDDTAEALEQRVSTMIVDPSVIAAALLFPYLTTLEETARLVLALKGRPGWSITVGLLENEIVGKVVSIRAARQIPFNQGTCESEALVLGNFKEFPPTRRSPVTAMEIFVGHPLPLDPKTSKPTTQANLAHIIRKDIYGERPYEVTWNASVEGRTTSLGTSNDNRAKAKVTLVVPVPLASKLGCLQ